MIYDVMGRASLALAAAAIAYAALVAFQRSPRVGARVRHRVLSVGTATTLLVLALSVLPHWGVLPSNPFASSTADAVGVTRATGGGAIPESLTDAASADSDALSSGAVAARPGLSGFVQRAMTIAKSSGLQAALLALWVLGAAALLVRLIAGERRLAALVQSSKPLPDAQRARLSPSIGAHSANDEATARDVDVRIGVTHTAILAAPLLGPTAILLPPAFLDWPQTRLGLVLAHERAHLRRADPTWLRLSLALRALLFWNPLAWYLAARLRREAELATDETVVADGANASDYAEMLLRAAVGDERVDASMTTAGFAASTGPDLVGRVTAILDAAPARDLSVRWQRALFGATALGALLLGCAAPADNRRAEQDGSDIPQGPAGVTATAANGSEALPDSSTEKPGAPQRAMHEREIRARATRLLTGWTERPGVRSARLVVLDATSGRILTALQSTLGEAPVDQLDLVPPGSTLKPFVAAAALEEGFDRRDILPGGTLELPDGVEIRDYTDHGPIDLDAVIARSSNVGIARVLQSLPARRLHRLLSDLQLRRAANPFQPGSQRDESAMVRATLGQSVRVHPLTLAAAYGVFVNGGEWVEPTASGNGARTRVLTVETAHALRDMLRGAVTRSDGTARRARVLETAAGKTGTVKTDTGRRAVFVGWVESAPGPVIAYVDIEVEGHSGDVYGGSTAVPAFVEAVEALVP